MSNLDAKQREAVSESALALVEEAKQIVVNNEQEKEEAGRFFLQCRKVRERIGEFFDPHINRAKEAKAAAEKVRAELARDKEKVEEPVKQAEEIAGRAIVGFDDRMRREAEERRRKAEDELRKRAEDEALAAAQDAEEVGLPEVADRILDSAANGNIPHGLPPVPTIAPSRIKGTATREEWKFEVVDLKALVRAWLEGTVPAGVVAVDTAFIGKIVRALKDQTNLPGVRVTCERKLVGTGR